LIIVVVVAAAVLVFVAVATLGEDKATASYSAFGRCYRLMQLLFDMVKLHT